MKMKKMRRKELLIGTVAFILAAVIMALCLVSPGVPEPKDFNKILSMWDVCKQREVADRIYVIDCSTFETIEARHLAVSLQGVVARSKPTIFIVTNDMDKKYLEIMKENGKDLVYTDSNGDNWTIETLLKKFKGYVKDDSYVLYKPSENGEGLNVATNYASLYGYLPVPESLEKIAKRAGLTIKEDLTNEEYDVNFQEEFFDEHKNEFQFKAVVSQKYDATGLRDLAIQQGFYVFYVDEDKDTDKFRGKIFEHIGNNVPVLGWAKYEVDYVSQASENGNMVIPSDHCHNNSILASVRCELQDQGHKGTRRHTDKTKHYCALVFSDGDNIQWIQNGYEEYFEKLELKRQFPVTWSISPLMQEFSPFTLNMVYSQATQDDYFIAGVSGAGYIHPTEYPKDALTGYTDVTAATMFKSDLDYVSILDFTPETNGDEKRLEDSLEYYARYSNIKGGVLSLDPDKYAGGQGRVYFVNGKPFISNRLSLWHPDGEGADVTEEWLTQQANIVNEYPVDIKSIDGYSVINVHPWSISVEDMAFFVSQLDKDVELVTLDELMLLVRENVPHETASPSK